MRTKNNTGLVVLILGLMMLLVRPYVIYNMTAANRFAGNPARAWSLLQRLVKKKDDHHAEEGSPVATVGVSRFVINPVRRLVVAFFAIFVSGVSFKGQSLIRETSSIFLPGQRYRYRAISCLLI